MSSSIEDKTVRPGSFTGYAYYHSNRRPSGLASLTPKKKLQHHPVRVWLILAALLFVTLILVTLNGSSKPASVTTKKSTPAPSSRASHATAPAAIAVLASACSTNTAPQLIIVSIAAKKLWACETKRVTYSSPVITGMSAHPDTITPLGDYQISAKIANTTLTGSDSTGSWSDPVSYWMPFLSNQYGVYGLHDATWRSNNMFGSVDPSSANASRGCVELPLAASKWIYNWVQVGTTVSIKS